MQVLLAGAALPPYADLELSNSQERLAVAQLRLMRLPSAASWEPKQEYAIAASLPPGHPAFPPLRSHAGRCRH